MYDFTYYNPVRAHFGRDAMEKLPEELVAVGKKVLLCYGGGSIKKNGLYDRVMKALQDTGKEVYELSGIMPNPRTEKVYEGIELCRKHDISFLLAVGGGSTIDCAKAISVGSHIEDDFFETFYKNGVNAEKSTPLGVILTIPATGSELDMSSVITKAETNEKLDYTNPALFPQFTILDPTLTYSLPKRQMVNGIIDTISHIYELYISPPDEPGLTDALSEAALRTEIESARIAIVNPEDYNSRANLMWTSSFALCGMLNNGKQTDWESHCIEHPLSAVFDIAHGAGLAVVHPAYLRYILPAAAPRLARLAKNVWRVDPTGKSEEEMALAAVEATSAFFRELGAPSTLSELGIGEDSIELLVDLTGLGCYSYQKLEWEDAVNILRSVL